MSEAVNRLCTRISDLDLVLGITREKSATSIAQRGSGTAMPCPTVRPRTKLGYRALSSFTAGRSPTAKRLRGDQNPWSQCRVFTDRSAVVDLARVTSEARRGGGHMRPYH